MNTKLKRFLSMLLVFVMVFSMMPANAETTATDTGVVVSGETPVETPAAKIGDTEYATLTAAFEAAEGGNEIVLLRDVDEVVRLSVSEADTVPSIILNLNGKTWDCGYGTRINAVSMIVKNGTIGTARKTLVSGDTVDVFYFGGHVTLPSTMELTGVTFNAELRVNNMAPSDEELGLLHSTVRSTEKAPNATTVIIWDGQYDVVTVQKAAYLTIYAGWFSGIHAEKGAYVTDNRNKDGESSETEETTKVEEVKPVYVLTLDEHGYVRTEKGVTITFVDYATVEERDFMQFTVGASSTTFTVQEQTADGWKDVDPVSGKSTIVRTFTEPATVTYRLDWDNNGTYDRLVVLVKAPVAKVGEKVYTSLADAFAAAKNEENIVVNLLTDATLDITAWETLAIGGDATSTITINGNGNTLTFNKLNSDWNHVATNNGAKLILNNMTITDSGYNNGPWNRYDINFACPVELNNVTSTKALAFKADATLNTVTINESGDNYAIWIQPNGQTVEINGLTVNSAGRGIKIDNQYVDNAALVNLTVNGATFKTEKKAAIVVKSPAGANVTLEAVDISGVKADSVNAVWNDEDAAAYFGQITVTGGSVGQEGVESFAAVVTAADGAVQGYYAKLEEAVAAALAGDTITLLADASVASIDVTDVTIDLNSKTLTLTAGDSNFYGASTVKNGTINITGCTAKGDCIIGVGDYSNSATLNLDNVNITGDGYSSAYAVLYVYNASTLNINGGSIVVSNDNASGGGVIKSENGTDGKINITGTESDPVELTFTDAKIGFLDGTVVMNYVDLDINGGANAINQSALTVKNSTLTIKDCDGRALTLHGGDVTIENSTLDFSGASEGEIRFKKALTLNVVGDTDIVACDIWSDVAGAKVVDADGTEMSVVGTEETPETVAVVGGKLASYVAQVGNTKYYTIDEAVAAWTKGTTLTLLADVTLSDVIKINTADNRTLNLGTFTMTAASGKNAIEIIAIGTGASEQMTITINADATNPGGINAGTKSIIYYDYSKGNAGGAEDRPIIKINGGVFTGSTSAWGTAGIYTRGSEARKCATLNITGGTFNCIINGTGKSKLLISGGTFNYSVGSQGDSTCYRLISGGTFKTLGFMTADSKNTKFWIGTAMANSNVGVYIDANGYLVVGGPVIKEPMEGATVYTTYGACWSDYLTYSSAAEYGLNYFTSDNTTVTDIFTDTAKQSSDQTVLLYTDATLTSSITVNNNLTLNLNGNTLTHNGFVLTKAGLTLTSDTRLDNVTTKLTGYIVTESEEAGVFTYKVEEAIVSVTDAEGNVTYFATLDKAFEAAVDGDTVTILKADTYTLSTSGKNITITGAVDGVVFDDIGAKNMGGANVTFNNVTFDYYPNVNYTGLQHSGNLTYNSCTFNGQVFLYGANETFNGCIFNQNSADAYNVWTYGAKNVEFNDCTFNCAGKSVLVYNEGGPATNLTVNDSTFEASNTVAGKAAIEIDTTSPNAAGGMDGTVISINNTTATGFDNGSVSGETLWNDKKDQTNLGVWVDNEQVWPIFVATVTDTEGNVEGFVALKDAFDAAEAGDTVTIFAGDYTENVSVGADITVVGETDAEGNNLVNITGQLSVSDQNATVKNLNVSNPSGRACVINGGNILIEGCNLTGSNGLRYCYANDGDVTIKDCVITGDVYGVHFDAGSGEGDVIIDGCTITGWTSFGSAIEGVTITDTTFKDGNYDKLRFFQDATVTNCTFPETMSIDFGMEEVTAKFDGCTVGESSSVADVVYLGDIVEMGVKVYVDGVLLVVEAVLTNEAGEKEYFLTLDKAFAAADDGDEVEILVAGTYALSTSGKNITITGAVDGVVFDNIGAKNMGGANVTFNNVTFDYYPNVNYTGLQHSGNLVYNDCTFEGQVFLYGASETFNGCTFNQNSADAYNVWTYGAKNVAFDDCEFNCAGKSVLVFNEGGPATNLTANDSTFEASTTVAGKAAIEIDTTSPNAAGGMDGTVISIHNTTATGFDNGSVSGETLWNDKKDQTNLEVWVDGEQVWPIFVAQIGETKYTSLAKALEAAQDGDTILVLKDHELSAPITVTKTVTINLGGYEVSYSSDVAGEAMITNKGNLTLSGEGKINYTYTGAADTSYSKGNYTISNGGTLTVSGPSVVNSTAKMSHACYTIDNNSSGGAATLIVDAGEVINSNNYAIRQFVNGNANVVTINGGNVTGTRAVWMQLAGSDTSKAPVAELNVTGGTLTATGESADYKLAVYSYSYGNSLANTKINISGGTLDGDVALTGGKNKTVVETVTVTGGKINDLYSYGEDELAVPAISLTGGTFNTNYAELYSLDDGYIFRPNAEGTYDVVNGTYVAAIGDVKYETLEAAVAAAQAGETVTLLDDITLTEVVTIEQAITLDLGSFTLTGADGAIVLNIKADTTIKNGTITGNKSGTTSGLIDIYADLTMEGVTVTTSKINALRFKAGECTATLTDCTVTGAFKGYGGSVWNIQSGTYMAASTAIDDQLNGSAAISGGTFHYAIEETECAPGYTVVDNGDGTWTVKYAPACFIDANNNGVLDEGEAVYASLEPVFANHTEGDVYVVLTADIAAKNQVDTDVDAHYYFSTNVAGGAKMDFLFADDWNYVQKMTVGENITLTAPYLLAWTELNINGKAETGYAYFMGADVTVAEGAELNVITGDATVQVKSGANLTVNGTVNASTINVWVGEAKLTVSGANAKVDASWIDIWDGTPSVVVESGATLTADNMKASRGGTITVDAATLDVVVELGHNGESKGEMTILNDGTIAGANLTTLDSTVTGPEGLTTITTDIADHKVVYEEGVYKVAPKTYVAETLGVKYETLAEALEAAKGESSIVVELLADATLDITSWQTLAIGGDSTTSITINGNGNKLTFNKLDSDWSHVATNNGATLILNDMTITDSGYNNGPWNRYDIVFAGPVELNNVTSTKALAFKDGATLNDVTIDESGDNYAIWIQPNGQTVTIDGLTVNSAGRGIKVDNQYAENDPAVVNLSVSNAVFNTANKAAILVKSAATTNVTLNNVDISGVAKDSTNAVWNDEDNALNFGMVNVTGGTMIQEGDFAAAITVDGKVQSYYKTLPEAVEAVEDGEIIWLAANIELTEAYELPKSITLETKGYTLKGELQLNDAALKLTSGDANLNVTTTVDGSVVLYDDGAYSVCPKPELPTATVTELENDALTFALNFVADPATDAQLLYYGGWYADFVLTLNKDATFNANGNADGYLGGQYDLYSENWVYVPFSDVTMTAGESLKIMEYAAELMGEPGLKFTYGDVYNFVKDFDCGVFFTDEYLEENKDLVVTLELRVYNPKDETESYVIGKTYVFRQPSADMTYSAYGFNVSGEGEKYRERFGIDLYNIYARKTLVIELYDEAGNLLATTSMRETDRDDGTAFVRPIQGSKTVNIVVDGRLAGSWDTEWAIAPSVDYIPYTAKIYADGVLVDTYYPVFDAEDVAEYVALPAVAKVASVTDTEGNVTYYGTLDKAFAAADDGDEVEILVAGTYALSTSGKNITITGAVDGVVFDNIGGKNMGGANVTFNNVTFDYYPNVNYTGLQHSGNLVYNDCIFEGQVFLYGASETFNRCIFNQNSAGAYNVWTYGAKNVAFDDCEFNCAGKSVLVFNEGGPATNLTVNDSTFEASNTVAGKAAIEIDTTSPNAAGGMDGTVISIHNTTATGFDKGSVSGETLWNDKMDQTNLEVWVDDVQVWPIFVAQVGETKYTTFKAALEVAQANTDDKTVILLEPVTITEDTTYDLTGVTVTSEGDAFIVTSGTLTLDGGVVKAGTSGTGSWTAVWANGGNVVINGGTYSVGGDSTTTDTTHQNDVIYTKNGGTVTIIGGTFLNNGTVWTLNQNDSTGGAITVTGGTFQGWNPENNVSEGPNTSFLPEGYIAVDNGDNSWTVTVGEWVAQIGETKYETLDKAFAAADDGDEVEILVAGTYALSTSGKNITITGAVDGVVFDNIGAKNMGGANVTFNNVTFDYYPNVNYTGLQHSGNLVYNDCIFEGQVFLYGASETFNGCIFNQNSADAYNVWTYGAKNVEFNECEFNCAGKSVLVFNEGGPATKLTVNDSTFEASNTVAGKAAIEIDTTSPNAAGGMDGTVISIHNTTATGFDKGSVSDETLWNDKKDQTNLEVWVDDVQVWPIFVAQVGETKYTSLQSAIDAAVAGDTVTVLKEIVLEQGVTIAADDSITLDLAGFTVSMTDASTSSSALITNNGTLKITGEGKLSYNATAPSTSYSTSTIINNGSLTVENGTFENTSPAGGASYVIDNYNTLTVNGGSFSASRIVLRQAQFGNHNNTVTIYGGTFTGYAGLQMHVFSAAKATTATINGGTFDGTYAFYTSFSAADVSANTKIVVNNGTFTGNSALFLYNSKTGAYDYAFDAEIKGGYFDGWVYVYANDAEGTSVDLPVITGGTYTIEPAETNIVDGYIAVDNGNGTWTVIEGEWVAQIGETKYTTLQAAADAAVDGDTIVLLTNIAEDVVVEQKPDVKITIDGAGKMIDGTITVNGKSARYATAGLTIQNVNFNADTISEDAFINLGGNNNIRYTSNVTISNCTFTAAPRNEGIVAIKQYTGGCKNLTVENCTATGVHSLIQLKNVEAGLSITGCTITDSKNGISVGNSVNATISGCTMDVNGYGIRADGNIANKLTVSDCTITAEMPIVVRKTTAAYELAISGTNELIAGNTEGYQVIFTNDDDGTYVEPTGAFVYTADEVNAELKVFPKYVAVNDGVKHTTFEAALAAAQANADDKTVILLEPVTITADTTYDLTDVTVTSEGDAFIVTGGTLTLNGDGTVEAGTSGAGSWNAVWANGGKVVINGGTYSVGGDTTTTDTTHQNDVIYTKNGGTVTIIGGTFLNDGTVWTLNQNDSTGAAITVTGGTFHNWNPADNVSEGANTNFVAEGYISETKDDGATYIVREANYVAQVGETKYETFDEALEAAKNGEDKTVILLQPVEITEDTTYDLTDVTVTSEGDAFIVTDGTLTLDGDGVVKAGTSGAGSWNAVWANGGDVVINGGTYSVGGDSTTTDTTHQNDVIYTKNGGTVTITGGTFLNDGTVWTLNQNDSTGGAITVTGGTFHNWNPADNVSEGANTNFVADGYISVDNGDGTWTVEEDGLFDIYGANVKLGDSLDMYFYVQKSDLDGTDYYAVITRTYADGTTEDIMEIPFAEWEEYNSKLWRFVYPSIAAKEMTDMLYVTVYNSDGSQASNEWIDCVRDYGVRTLNNPSSSVELLTTVVDMLNYGAAAQSFFGYHTDDLANSTISSWQQYATPSVSYSDHREKGPNFAGSTVSTKSELMLTFYFNNITPDMTARVSYTDHYGNSISKVIDGSNFFKRGSMYGVDVTGLSVASGRQLVTCEVIDTDGVTVVAYAKDSVEGYVARGTGDAVYEMLMKFVQSAYNYFH